MADTPPASKTGSLLPYVWAAIIFALIGVCLILGILFLRPGLDPLLLITAVTGAVSIMFTGVAALLKSQETHATVNSQLTAWKEEFFKMAHAEGIIAGTALEQARVAEQKRIAALVPSAAPAVIATTETKP